MAKSLVIVESPTKVKTINKILGTKYKVLSSMGHIVDLPKSVFGVDIEDKFKPKWVILRAKQKVLNQLKKEAKNVKDVYIATDPDREGEAIGWNISNQLGEDKKYYRVMFHEITKEAVAKAFKNPLEFDLKKVDAQVARRILDRIVGYKLSPLLWQKVGSRLSAGRVQSVALRIIVDREREIKNFVPQEYWEIDADLKRHDLKDILKAGLEKINDQKFEIANQKEAEDLSAQLRQEKFSIANIVEKEIRRNPSPPFITSSLQQEAFNKLGFNTSKTMIIAQQLYEGIELGAEEAVGLITYMRTDSVNISKEAILRVRDFIKTQYGEQYLPQEPNTYKSKKSAQEAHEAIRPSDCHRTPASIRQYLDDDQYRLYELIWERFLACQMTPAVFLNKKIEIKGGKFQFGVSGSILIFEGYLASGTELRSSDGAQDLSVYEIGDVLDLMEVHPSQHFTKPPARYSEGSLVKALEEDGIGRPSTYAPIIQTLVFRNYVNRQKGYFSATELGMLICDLLVQYFPKIMDIGFTATMEEHLDLVEEGDLDYLKLLNEFYQPFKEELEFASGNIEKTQTFLDKDCPQCGKKMMVKWGRNGKFSSCSGFPACKYSEPFSIGIKCPNEGCGGDVVERRSHRGRIFFGCSHYPKCNFISNKMPESSSEKQSTAMNGETISE